ncbi:hypothetical protein QQX98_003600 [Neonectria punicea]|uniref:Uncharacterized protein n=1 Tax=Neonectria punicea TaxID=979145 RepID=A0ABR1HD90_9HYPO
MQAAPSRDGNAEEEIIRSNDGSYREGQEESICTIHLSRPDPQRLTPSSPSDAPTSRHPMPVPHSAEPTRADIRDLGGRLRCHEPEGKKRECHSPAAAGIHWE